MSNRARGVDVLAQALKVKRQDLIRHSLTICGGKTHTRACGDVLLARLRVAAVDKI